MDTDYFLTQNEGITNGRKTLLLSVREHFDGMLGGKINMIHFIRKVQYVGKSGERTLWEHLEGKDFRI